MNKKELTDKILKSLRDQGFDVDGNQLTPRAGPSKSSVRSLHSRAVAHSVDRARADLFKRESDLLRNIADGPDVDPVAMDPELVEVARDSREELLFRYAKLHWSIPISAGYGRRLRFIVRDRANGKLVALIGLGDPVVALRARDEWVGWTADQRRLRLSHVMDAFVLGGVPPYSFILGGKLAAMLTASNEVRAAFSRKYAGRESTILGRTFDGRLAAVTTASALGKSSVYDRVRFQDRTLFEPVGFTNGTGEFQFSNGVYADIFSYATRYCSPTSRNPRWGGVGFRNKRELVTKCLEKIGLSRDLLYHGIKRENFVVPLARNTKEFLRGEQDDLDWYQQSVSDLFTFFRTRWLLPRSERETRWKAWNREAWRLWPEGGEGETSAQSCGGDRNS